MKADIELFASALGERNAAALLFDEFKSVNVDFSIFSANTNINVACIYKDSGEIFAIYSRNKLKPGACPFPKGQMKGFTSNSLIIMHEVIKKGKIIGKIYIESDLKGIQEYEHYMLISMLIIICSIVLISYTLAVKLQRVIHRPIIKFLEDANSITELGDYSARVKKLYADELGGIIDKFNKILEERESKNKDFFEKSQKMEVFSKQSLLVKEYINKEFKNPFNAANSFRVMLEKQVFGPVNPVYIEYFNDVCSADVELYSAVNKVMDLYKIQMEIYGEAKKSSKIDDVISKLHAEYLDDNKNIKFVKNTSDVSETLFCYNMINLFLENIFALFIISLQHNNGNTYSIKLDSSKMQCNQNSLRLYVELQKEGDNRKYINDNFNNLKLSKLLDILKNSENITDSGNKLIVDFNNMLARGKLHILNFLSELNNCSIITSIAADKVAITVLIPWESVAVEEVNCSVEAV